MCIFVISTQIVLERMEKVAQIGYILFKSRMNTGIWNSAFIERMEQAACSVYILVQCNLE